MKKFIDNARHDEPWFVELPIEMKAAFDFLWAKCDCAGVWNGSTKIADIQLGKKVGWDELVKQSGGRIVRLANGAFFFPEYVKLQCGELNENCPPHRTVIKTLRNHGLLDEGSLSVRLLVSLQDKEEEEEEDKDEEKDKSDQPQKSKTRGTLEEVQGFCISIGLPPSDGESTFHKWEGNGWTNNGKPIKDWRATARNWKLNNFFPSQKPNGHATNGNQTTSPHNALSLNRTAASSYRQIGEKLRLGLAGNGQGEPPGASGTPEPAS